MLQWQMGKGSHIVRRVVGIAAHALLLTLNTGSIDSRILLRPDAFVDPSQVVNPPSFDNPEGSAVDIDSLRARGYSSKHFGDGL